MNVAQICRRALLDSDAIQIDLTSHRFFTQLELLSWANDAKDWIERALYQSHQDYNLVFRTSASGSLRWDGETYAHSSFQLNTARTYTLPPDIMSLRSIRSAAASARRFDHLDISDPYFRDLENRTDVVDPIYWDVVGDRTLVIANPLASGTLDIVISYIGRSRKLRVSDTPGTVAVTQDSTAAVGTSTTWVDQELAIPAELIVSTSTAAPIIVSQTSGLVYVDPSAIYPPIATFVSDTSITLAGNWLIGSLTGRGHMVASVPSLPAEYIYLTVEYVKAKCLEKGGKPNSDKAMAEVMGRITAIGTEFSQRVDAAGKTGTLAPDARPGQSWAAGLQPGQLRASQSGGRQ